MERCQSVLSLSKVPPAKPHLVTRTIRSDGEGGAGGDTDFKSRRKKARGSHDPVASSGAEDRSEGDTSSQYDLWKSIQMNYAILMADDLITQCQETRNELHVPLPPNELPNAGAPPSHHMLSYAEFTRLCNDVHDKLHGAHALNPAESEMQVDSLYSECQYLKQQGSLLKMMRPDLKDDVNRRCCILANKLEVLLPRRARHEEDGLVEALKTEMKDIRKWLQDVEVRLRSFAVSENGATEDMNRVLCQEKSLQREIEERGRELTSVVRRCESLGGAAVGGRLTRAAAYLERSWHNIWIRSVEKQCLTEQRLADRYLQQQQQQNRPETPSSATDEEPQHKHRRLTLDRWTAVRASPTTMERARRDALAGLNDKGVMVGTTGIAALKAEYGDDFTNFEIIQDVGYSSESSAHLSSDDGRHIRVYEYGKAGPASSLGSSSSSGPSSFDDSGLGGSRLVLRRPPSPDPHPDPLLDPFGGPGDESDFLDAVLRTCPDLDDDDVIGEEPARDELQYPLSGVESDGSSVGNIQNRSSFTSSSNLYYKIIPVDSENDEEALLKEESTFLAEDSPSKSPLSSSDHSTPVKPTPDGTPPPDCTTPPRPTSGGLDNHHSPSSPGLKRKRLGSDPPPRSDTGHFLPSADPQRMRAWLKRCTNGDSPATTTPRDVGGYLSDDIGCPKTDDSPDAADASTPHHAQVDSAHPHRVRSWLRRLRVTNSSSIGRTSGVRRSLFKRVTTAGGYSSSEDSAPDPLVPPPCVPDSCDASGEYTSSSCDEGNPASSSCDDGSSPSKGRRGYCSLGSGEGSVETVIRGLEDFSPPLLPPPLHTSTPSGAGGDLQWLVLKASSEGDVRTRSAFNATSRQRFESAHLLSASLPNVLAHRPSPRTFADVPVKRRGSRKSTSSNRSSRSRDRPRHRSRTLTGSFSQRRRHSSHTPDTDPPSEGETGFFEVSSLTPAVGTSLKTELEMALSGRVLSPDVVLEEQSTVSDQVWDNYQDLPYLSENYSEATVDEDAVRKLTEFGDDYGSAIGREMRFCAKPSPKKAAKCTDSDSDLEDLHHVIEEASKALHVARNSLRRRQAGDFFSSVQNSELLATCGTHLHCLQRICEHLEADQKDTIFDNDLKALYGLISEWEGLKRSVAMHDDPRQKYRDATEAISTIAHKMSELELRTEAEAAPFASWEVLQRSMDRLQEVLHALKDLQDQLLAVNLQVHRFMREHGYEYPYRGCSLKDDVTVLYQRCHEEHDRSETRLAELKAFSEAWKDYEEDFRVLSEKLVELEKQPSPCNCDKLIALESDLRSLRERSERHLRDNLDGASAWTRVEHAQKGLERRIADVAAKSCPPAAPKPRRPPRWWRALRVAVPVQVALVLLLCLACYLEPRCCDRLNNFAASLSPRLSYPGGPPSA